LPARLYVSVDKGQSFTQIAATQQGMFGFALSPDGSQLVYGGPGDGLFRGPSDGSGPFVKLGTIGVRCLRWPSEDALYACATEPRDPFSVAVSHDQGESFEPLYRMLETCPQACPEGTSFALSCEEAWSTTRPFITATGSMCAVPWAAPPEPEDAGARPVLDGGNAGAKDGGQSVEPDAGTEAKPRSRSSGCSVHTTRGEGALFLAILGALLAARDARRRRAGRRP
jgi:MYXO-CTERM domain-containing protein